MVEEGDRTPSIAFRYLPGRKDVVNQCLEFGGRLLGHSDGLLTPLTFAGHRLSPLAAFTSGVYFAHNGRR